MKKLKIVEIYCQFFFRTNLRCKKIMNNIHWKHHVKQIANFRRSAARVNIEINV